jgi:hypothetical protein
MFREAPSFAFTPASSRHFHRAASQHPAALDSATKRGINSRWVWDSPDERRDESRVIRREVSGICLTSIRKSAMDFSSNVDSERME